MADSAVQGVFAMPPTCATADAAAVDAAAVDTVAVDAAAVAPGSADAAALLDDGASGPDTEPPSLNTAVDLGGAGAAPLRIDSCQSLPDISDVPSPLPRASASPSPPPPPPAPELGAGAPGPAPPAQQPPAGLREGDTLASQPAGEEQDAWGGGLQDAGAELRAPPDGCSGVWGDGCGLTASSGHGVSGEALPEPTADAAGPAEPVELQRASRSVEADAPAPLAASQALRPPPPPPAEAAAPSPPPDFDEPLLFVDPADMPPSPPSPRSPLGAPAPSPPSARASPAGAAAAAPPGHDALLEDDLLFLDPLSLSLSSAQGSSWHTAAAGSSASSSSLSSAFGGGGGGGFPPRLAAAAAAAHLQAPAPPLAADAGAPVPPQPPAGLAPMEPIEEDEPCVGGGLQASGRSSHAGGGGGGSGHSGLAASGASGGGGSGGGGSGVGNGSDLRVAGASLMVSGPDPVGSYSLMVGAGGGGGRRGAAAADAGASMLIGGVQGAAPGGPLHDSELVDLSLSTSAMLRPLAAQQAPPPAHAPPPALPPAAARAVHRAGAALDAAPEPPPRRRGGRPTPLAAAAAASSSAAAAAAVAGAAVQAARALPGSSGGGGASDDDSAVLVEMTPDMPVSVEAQEAEQWRALVFADGRDSHGRPVVVVNTDALPDRADAADAALAYATRRLLPLVSQGAYVLVLVGCSGGGRFRALAAVWAVRAHQALPRPFRKNVRYVVLVQPSVVVRGALAVMRPLLSAKAAAKIRSVGSLLDLDRATRGEVQVAHLGEAFICLVQGIHERQRTAQQAAAAAAAAAQGGGDAGGGGALTGVAGVAVAAGGRLQSSLHAAWSSLNAGARRWGLA